MERREQQEPLTRNWNELTRAEQIETRHRIHGICDIPNDEYAASWADVKILLDQHAALVEQRDRLLATLRRIAAYPSGYKFSGAISDASSVGKDREEMIHLARSVVKELDTTLATVWKSRKLNGLPLKCPNLHCQSVFWNGKSAYPRRGERQRDDTTGGK